MATPPSGPVSFVAWRPRDGVRSSAAALGARHVPETVHLAAKRLGAGCAALVLAAFGGAEMRLVLEGAALARQGARGLGRRHVQPGIVALLQHLLHLLRKRRRQRSQDR